MREKIFARACGHLLDRRRRGGAHSPIGRGLARLRRQGAGQKGGGGDHVDHHGPGLPRSRRPEGGQITIALDRVIAMHMKSGRGQRVETASTKRQSKIAFEGWAIRAQAKPASTPCSAIDPTSQAHAWLRADDACSRQTARQGASDQARRRRPPGRYCQARAARSPQTRHRCRAWLPRRYRY